MRRLLLFLLLVALPAVNVVSGETRPKAAHDPVVTLLHSELDRAMTALSKSDPAPYFLSYSVSDKAQTVMMASGGAMLTSVSGRRRMLDVSIRVGSAALDNTHDENRASGLSSGTLPLADDADAIRRTLWLTTDAEYKKAAQAYLKAKTQTAVRAKAEDDSPDFSVQKPSAHADAPLAPQKTDLKAQEAKLRAVSAEFLKHRDVYTAAAILLTQESTRYFVSSEGSELVTRQRLYRVMLLAETRADDGMELMSVETFQSSSLDKLPTEAQLIASAQKLVGDLRQLRTATVAEPYDGPALLSGRAAAVFFHEVLGHRLEGQRQRGEEEGQTFTKKIGKPVLPDFMDVVDDPLTAQLGGMELSGSYQFDEEGVPAHRVELIQKGILENFLMSRMPVKNFAESNGHGRGEEGRMPAGRQGNLIVTSANKVPDADLRARLIEEAKKQDRPYGLYFEDIQGGFTLTTRSLPQSFQVLPVKVWRVYTDGRPDELVRGIDIVGTPLTSLTRIVVTGTQQSVFNGVCGAESGQVPVSAVSPAILMSSLEVQKRAKSKERPPILPPPGFADEKTPKTGGGGQ